MRTSLLSKTSRFVTVTLFFSLIITCIFHAGFFVPSASAELSDLMSWADGLGPNKFEDNFCKRRLAGTMSRGTCMLECPGGVKSCKVSRTFKAKYYDDLEEDVDCYGCAAEQSCYDLRLIYGWPDCFLCENDPKKKCVKEISTATPLGIGPASIPLPKDSSGTQCWDCVNRKDECQIHFGFDVHDKPTCENICKGKKDHKCKFKGKEPVDGNDCYQCLPVQPPPETCKDLKLLKRAECLKCKPPTPLCVDSGRKTKSGEKCFECEAKPKTCEEQGLKSGCAADEVCNKVKAPNGADCCTCTKKPKACKDFGLRDIPCKCKKNQKVVDTVRVIDGVITNCCQCIDKACYPNLEKADCEKCEEKGGKCRAMTAVRGGPECYRCVMPEEEGDEVTTCKDYGYAEKCSPNPCLDYEVCSEKPFTIGGKETVCAVCEPKDEDIEDPECTKQKLNTSCAECYQAQHACQQIQISQNPEKWCARCYRPEDGDICAEYEMNAGTCQYWPCPMEYDCQEAVKKKGKKKVSCYQCVAASEEDYCQHHDAMTKSLCEMSCLEYEECVMTIQGKSPKGEQWSCYDCKAKGYCEESGYVTAEDCIDCREKGGVCNYEKTIKEQPCYSCKTREELYCAKYDGTLTAAQCKTQCSGKYQECRFSVGYSDSNTGEEYNCYRCEVSGHCKEKGLFSGADECQKCRDSGGECVQAEYIEGEYCYACCGAGTEKGTCPQECASDEECVNAGYYCHRCQKKEMPCDANQGEYTDSNCAGTCDSNQECLLFQGDDTSCYICVSKEAPEPCMKFDLPYASCNDCPPVTYCKTIQIEGAVCIDCVPEGQSSCVEYEARPGTCPQECEDGKECFNEDIGDGELHCHNCVNPTPPCQDGEVPGECNWDTCSEGQDCVVSDYRYGRYCHVCQDSEKIQSQCNDGMDNDQDGLVDFPDDSGCRSPMDNVEMDPQCSDELDNDEDLKIDFPEDPSCTSRYDESEGAGPEEEPRCTDGLLDGPCADDVCSEDQECVPAGGNCHSCREKMKSCEDMGMYDGETCTRNCENADGSRGKCFQRQSDDHGVKCWECITTEQEQACNAEQGWGSGRCSPSKCRFGESCTESSTWGGQVCFKCHAEDQQVCPIGWKLGNCMTAAMSSDMQGFGQMCIDNGIPCYKYVSIDSGFCEDPLRDGQCPEECSSNQYCQNMGPHCYMCEEGEDPSKICYNRQQQDGPCRDDSCDSGSRCEEFNYDGTKCHWCTMAPTAPEQCDDGRLVGDCGSGVCEEKEACVPAGEGCHTCRVKTCAELNSTYIDTDACNECDRVQGKKCVLKDRKADGRNCYACEDDPTDFIDCRDGGYTDSCDGVTTYCKDVYYQDKHCCECVPKVEDQVSQCDDGYAPGGCPGNCNAFADQCYERSGPCHYCAPLGCPEGTFRMGQCESCRASRGKCRLVSGSLKLSGMSTGPLCYECEYPESCEKYDQFSDCGECYEDEVCLPGRIIDSPSFRRKFQCVRCEQVLEVTYIVIIIETPRVRYVLKNKEIDPSSLTGFSPNSVMALAKVEAPMVDQIKQLANMAQGGFTIGSIKEIAGMISENLGSKRSRYNDECFENLQAKGSAGDAGETKQARSGGSGSSDFGSDASQDFEVDGPIAACGQTGKQDTLAVFGADGSLVRNITKDELISNPNILIETFTKAENAFKKVMDLRNMTPQGALQKIQSTLVSKIMEPRDSEQVMIQKKKRKRKKKVDIESIDPNDPLFLYDKDRRKEQFGKYGRTQKKRAPVSISIGISYEAKSASEKKSPDDVVQDQWGLHKIGYLPKSDPNSAWNLVDAESKNVLVAVIDSGLDMTHPDGPQYIWTNSKEIPDNGIDDDANGYIDDVYGWNFLDNNNDLTDYKGHGTFVAGIIAAKSNNGIGVAGINPGAIIMPLKVTDAEGETDNLRIYRAIHYAVDNGAKLINVSLGGREVSKLEQAAINYAYRNGAFISIASGNNGLYLPDLGPASAKRAFAVGAIDKSGVRSTISSYGPNNCLLAPGEEIYSLRSKDSLEKRAMPKDPVEKLYYTQIGTSFSAPMVTATASLMLVKDPTLTNDQIARILLGTATPLGESDWDGENGAGLLNATKALQQIGNDFLTVMVTNVRQNEDERGRFASLDVFGSVIGEFKEFSVEVGKGKRARKFKKVAGPFNQKAFYDWVATIDKDNLKGSREWIVRINVTDQQGKQHVADTLVEIK